MTEENSVTVISTQELLLLLERPDAVRCKDCRYMTSPDGYSEFCMHLDKFVSRNWYCGDGINKKKEVK